jgi:hypothetical protein
MRQDPIDFDVATQSVPLNIEGSASSADNMGVSSTCERRPSFSKQRAKCVFTVFGETPSTCAACGPLNPLPISVATRAVEVIGKAGERFRPERRLGDCAIDPIQQFVVVHSRIFHGTHYRFNTQLASV